MSGEDSNLSLLRRNSNYFERRAVTNNANIAYYFPAACSRSIYPGSFTPSGLYIYGATVDSIRPNWDVDDGKPLNWDYRNRFYSAPETFHKEFNKNGVTILDRNGRVPYTMPRQTGGVRTPTGWRKPSIQGKQIWSEQEKYYNDY